MAVLPNYCSHMKCQYLRQWYVFSSDNMLSCTPESVRIEPKYHITSSNVPAVINIRPRTAFFVSFSLSTK